MFGTCFDMQYFVCLVLVLICSTLCPIWIRIHLDEEERADCFDFKCLPDVL